MWDKLKYLTPSYWLIKAKERWTSKQHRHYWSTYFMLGIMVYVGYISHPSLVTLPLFILLLPLMLVNQSWARHEGFKRGKEKYNVPH